MLREEKQATALLLNHISWLTGQYTQGLLDQEFRCIILELSSAWKTALLPPALEAGTHSWNRSAHTVPGLGLKFCGAKTPEVVSNCGWISEASFLHPQQLSGNRTIIVQSQLTVVYQEWSPLFCQLECFGLSTAERRHVLGAQGDEEPKSMFLFARKPPPGPCDMSHARDLNCCIIKPPPLLPQILWI